MRGWDETPNDLSGKGVYSHHHPALEQQVAEGHVREVRDHADKEGKEKDRGRKSCDDEER